MNFKYNFNLMRKKKGVGGTVYGTVGFRGFLKCLNAEDLTQHLDKARTILLKMIPASLGHNCPIY